MGDRIDVFISSTLADLAFEREFVALTCRRMGLLAHFYPEESTAGSLKRDYLRQLHKCHLMICILTTESAAVVEELELAQQLGIPVVELAPERPTSDGRFSRLKGAGSMFGRFHRFQHAYRSLADLETAIEAAISEIFTLRWTSAATFGTLDGRVYDNIAVSLREASYRYGAGQETSILVLGPRRARMVYESQYLDATRERIERCLNDGSDQFTFVHIFSAAKTLDAAQLHEYPRLAESLEWLEKVEPRLRDNPRVVVAPIDGEITAAHICDTTIGIATQIVGQHWVTLNAAGLAANDLWKLMLQARDSNGIDLKTFIEQVRCRI